MAKIRDITFYKTETGRASVFEFIESLKPNDKAKVIKVFETIEVMRIVPTKFLKKLNGPHNIWEIRVRDLRFLGFYAEPSRFVLTNAFLKQSQATPGTEIAVAIKRKNMYLSPQRQPA